MPKGSDASHDDHESVAVVESPPGGRGRGHRKTTISAPNPEDLVPASSSSSTSLETPITVKVHKEYPRFRFIGRYKFKHEDKFITERVYASAPRKENDVPCPSLKDMLKDVFCGCFF